MIGNVPPFIIFVAGAALILFLPRRWHGWFSLSVATVALVNFATLAHGTYWQVQMLDYQLTFGRIDTLAYLFGLLFHIAAVIATLFAFHVRDPVQNVAALLYAGGAVGAVIAGDLITLFIFWEAMAVASTFLIWAQRSTKSNHTGQRYLLVQVTSGVLLLAGAASLLVETGSVTFDQIGLQTFGGKLIFIAFGIGADLGVEQLIRIALIQWWAKIAYESLATPLTYGVATYLKRWEEMGVYDRPESLNPLIIFA